MITRKQLYLGCAISASVLSSAAYGAGFALIEHSASGMGNAFAGGAASAEDASTVFFNPAGMMVLPRDQVMGAFHIIRPTADYIEKGSVRGGIFSDQALEGDTNVDGGEHAIVPNFYYVQGFTDKVKIGFGVNVPFGLGVKYDDDWIGRYHAVESELKTVNFNPAIAMTVSESVAVGFGLNLQLAEVILSSAIDFGSLLGFPQQYDGFAYLEGDNGDSPGWGWNAGLMYQASESTRIGVAYRSEVEHDVDGTADFTVPSAANSYPQNANLFVDTGLSASVTFPQSLSFSVFHGMGDLALMGDITWTGWSSFEELRIEYDNADQADSVTTEAWEDTLRIAFGLNYRTYPDWLLRAGVAYDQTPIPNKERRTPRIPGNDRLWFSVGLGHRLNKAMNIDVGYSHLRISNAEIHNELESSLSVLNATVVGEYEADVDIVSAQLTWDLN